MKILMCLIWRNNRTTLWGIIMMFISRILRNRHRFCNHMGIILKELRDSLTLLRLLWIVRELLKRKWLVWRREWVQKSTSQVPSKVTNQKMCIKYLNAQESPDWARTKMKYNKYHKLTNPNHSMAPIQNLKQRSIKLLFWEVRLIDWRIQSSIIFLTIFKFRITVRLIRRTLLDILRRSSRLSNKLWNILMILTSNS